MFVRPVLEIISPIFENYKLIHGILFVNCYYSFDNEVDSCTSIMVNKTNMDYAFSLETKTETETGDFYLAPSSRIFTIPVFPSTDTVMPSFKSE